MHQKTGARSFPGKTPIQDRFLVLSSRRNHMRTAITLKIDFYRATEIHLPDQIVRNKLHYDGTRARRPAQCPVLTTQHRAVRFNFFKFARKHQNRQIRHWRAILHTDESKFTESTNDIRGRVWRPQEERYADCNIVEVHRYDGGSS